MSAPEPTARPFLRVVRDEEGSPYPKASLFLRTLARLLDLAVAAVLYRVTGPAGIVVALLYLLFADGMLHGQSFGKKICGVKVIYLPTRSAARYRDSVLRNAPFGLVLILGMMPDLGFVAFLAGVALIGAVESYKVLRDGLGMRFGDLWAQTQVIDGKVVAGQMMSATSRGEHRMLVEGNEPPRASKDENDRRGG